MYLTFGCKKNTDTQSPIISIEEPYVNSSFDIPVTIKVKGEVFDNNYIKNIKIGLLNQNLTNVVPEVNINLNIKEYIFEISFDVNDRLIESGKYFVSVKSFDNQGNKSSSYREIYLSEIPKVFKSLFVITSENNITNLLEIDTNGSSIISHNLVGEFQSSIANSRHQYIFMGTNQLGSAFNIDDYSEIWNISPHFSLYPFFTGIYKSDYGNQLHLVFGDGLINTYNKNGQIINTLYSNFQEWFGKAYFDENYIIAEVFSNLISRHLVVCFKNSGIEFQRIQIQGKLNNIGKITDNIYYVVIQNQTNLMVYTYDLSSNSIWLENEISNCIINDILYINNLLYMATDLGFYSYNYISSSLNLISSLNFFDIKYESINNELFLSSGKDIWIYQNGSNPSLLHTLNDSIKEMMLFYNK